MICSFTHKDFTKMADIIMNKFVLIIDKIPYRICEIEFYYNNKDHPDEYTHKSPEQSKSGYFYFHKFSNGTYKEGTHKGLDITCGNENLYCGILIRSIMNLLTNEFIEGSCKIVNKIISSFNSYSVKDFMLKHNKKLKCFNKKNNFYLQNTNLIKEPLYYGPRIGLSNKYPEFKNKYYRYSIFKDKIKKQKNKLYLVSNLVK